VGQPRNAHAVALTEADSLHPDTVDDPDDFVTRNDPGMFGGQVTFGQMEICPADAACPYADTNLAATW
jgi:hypothetical protein